MPTSIDTIVLDGKLEKAEAINALRIASQRVTEALPKALENCKTNSDRQRVIADRDTIVLAFLTCLEKSLEHTGPLFEQMAADLNKAAKGIKKKANDVSNAVEAINLFSDIVRLAGSIALAFR